MKLKTLKATFAALALLASGSAAADFGIGIKAGTLGAGLEARWDPPVPWFDIRVGINRYDFEDESDYAGINYDATLALDSYYLTTNFKVPASPFRLTLGAFANGNELQLSSVDTMIEVGGTIVDTSAVGTITSNATFESTAPYAGIGFDFELFGKAGLNFDLGLLWQDEPMVTLGVSNWDNLTPAEQALVAPLIAAERDELQDDVKDFKAWPVVSLAFVYNF